VLFIFVYLAVRKKTVFVCERRWLIGQCRMEEHVWTVRSSRSEGGVAEKREGVRGWSVWSTGAFGCVPTLQRCHLWMNHHLPQKPRTESVRAGGSHVFYGWLTGDRLHVRIGKRYNHVMLFGKSKLEWHWNNPVPNTLFQSVIHALHSCSRLRLPCWDSDDLHIFMEKLWNSMICNRR